MKVFCDDCRHFNPMYSTPMADGRCNNPTNIINSMSADTWRTPGYEIIEHIRSPKDINILNNCTSYEDRKL